MFVSKNELRARFCAALWAMYRTEVPLYGDLIELVDDINEKADGKPEGESWNPICHPRANKQIGETERIKAFCADIRPPQG